MLAQKLSFLNLFCFISLSPKEDLHEVPLR